MRFVSREERMARLGKHLTTANHVRKPVREYINQLGAPFLIGEIWRPLGLTRGQVQRELSRMLDEGLLNRRLIRVPGAIPTGKGEYLPNRCMRSQFLYSLAGGYE